jgi:hypothetical protein
MRITIYIQSQTKKGEAKEVHSIHLDILQSLRVCKEHSYSLTTLVSLVSGTHGATRAEYH